MAATICPTVTTDNPQTYLEQMERVEPFAARIHVDAADGIFTHQKLISFDQIWWRGNRTIDLHVMYKHPWDHLDIILALNPRLVIVHAEAEGNFIAFARQLRRNGIEAGIALLPHTKVETIEPALEVADHVLIFSGNLGEFGGEADLSLLDKVTQVRALRQSIEIGWDGGVNDKNAKQLADAGVDVLNVGGYIQHAEDPAHAYATLKALV